MMAVIDDFTHQPILEGRYFEVGLRDHGDASGIAESVTTADIRMVLWIMKKALTGTPKPELAIFVRTTYFREPRQLPEWATLDTTES